MLRSDGHTTVDATHRDLVRDVLDSLKTGRAEPVAGGGGGGVGETRGEGGCADVVCCFSVGDLYSVNVRYWT